MLALTSFDSAFLPHVERETLREAMAIEVGDVLAEADGMAVMA
jgi:hypothetical protein